MVRYGRWLARSQERLVAGRLWEGEGEGGVRGSHKTLATDFWRMRS